MAAKHTLHPPVRFDTSPERYRHWELTFPAEHGGKVAKLAMNVKEELGLRPGYVLKLNSYDLGVDIELADALMRIRFEHPEVRAIEITSSKERIFCSGANIYMLGSSSHAFKVNFCKYTNETRLYLEDMSAHSGISSLCALSGTASGGGYELAIACDEIVLQDDGASAVSLPECPLLGVLPGTGGLTRLVDKRKIRRDLADAFSTLAEGVRGKRALEWGLVDEAPPKPKMHDAVRRRLEAMVARSRRVPFPPTRLKSIEVERSEKRAEYKYVSVTFDRAARTATITVRAPDEDAPKSPADLAKLGCDAWCIRAFRELDDAILDLRFNQLDIGTVALKTSGDAKNVLAWDELLAGSARDGLVIECIGLIKRVLKRIDVTSKSFFAVIEPNSAFAGSLFELALASDRIYMKDEAGTHVWLSPLSAGALPMANGLSRLESRFLRDPTLAKRALEMKGPIDTHAALEAGLVTFAPDDIDWDDELRIAFEERASLSPDALTGMEASLRFGGPETMETKIFGRLSAWQNWIFQRPNAVGDKGALTLYGSPERPEFEWERT
jgi:benzoyl-CoA-dihydrodiol lyase